GFDTRGFKSGHSVEGCLWLGDFDPGSDGKIAAGDAEKPELELTAEIYAGVNAKDRLLGLPVAKLTGQGTIGADIKIDLDDDDSVAAGLDTRSDADKRDGKFHLD